MKKIVLLGGGGHCISVLDSIFLSKEYDEVAIVDSNLPVGKKILGCNVVGSDDLLPKLKQDGFDYAFITVGSIKTTSIRRKLYNLAKAIGFSFPIVCDPSAIISKYSNIGAGSFIGKSSIINAKCEIGDNCIINTGAILEHECSVDEFSHISVGAIICGNSSVGHDSFIGAGSTVIQGLQVGNNVIVGAGSTVINNIEDNSRFTLNKNLLIS